MISISNAFRQLLKSGDTDYQNIVIITLANGTVLGDLTHEHILIGGIDKDNAVSEDTAFTALGAAIINSISVTIDNRDETYSNYDFKGAKVTYRIRKLVNGTVENLLIGTYTVEDTRYNGFSIILECLDYMEKFDRPYVTGLNYPTSALNVVREACSKCGVLLNETRTGFPSLSDSIDTKPEGDAITYRDVIASIAQMHGYYAFANVNGRLDFGWFNRSYLDTLISRIDNNTFNPANIDLTKVHYIDSLFSQDISVDDVYISGVAITITQEVTVTDEETGSTSQQDVATTYSRGTDDYVISIEDNLFINADNVNVIADRLADLLIGLRFRKCTITHLNDFTMEAGDIAVIKDRKGSYYPILVTRSNFKVGGRQTTVSGAETPSRNVSKIYSKYTKNIVRNNALLNREKTQRELQYEDLVDKLANSNGLYMTADVDEGGASIYYLHNKPNKDESNIIWKMTSEAVAVSSDGGETWNAGLTVDGALLVKILSAIGINADWINAGAITVTDPNGNVIFEVSKDENRVIIRDTAISIGGMKLPDKLDEIMSNISWQSDTKIETWYQDTDPSLTWGQKESNWIDSTSADILDQNGEPIPLLSEMQESDHNGDIWHKTDDNTEWRYQDGEWQPVDVPDYVFDKIDGKAAIWGVQPVPPYNENDLWFTGEDILYCVHSRAENESFVESDWIKKDYYTDDSALQEWITGDYKDTIDDIKTQVDGKAETWYQANDPSTAWTTPELKNLHKGDLWFKTTDSTTWFWNGTKWEESQSVPQEVFDKIDSKAQIFASQPTPPYQVGDLWFTGTNILYCVRARAEGASYAASDWVKKDYYTDYHQMTSYETWQQLTNNGTLQGIVYDQNTGQLYINGEYIRANTLDGDLIKAGSIKADRLAIASGTNMYASYDTMSQIVLSTLTDATSPSATAGITTTSRGPGYNLYNADSNIPVYGVKYFRLFASSSDTNVYIFLGHSSTQEGRIPVRNLQKYRISFYARGNISGVSLALWIREFSGQTETYQSVAKTYTLTTSWKRYEADYTAEPHTSGGTYYSTTHIRLGFALRTASAYLDVCAIMVEEIENFNYATSAFSPASITVIDGGNIRSKSITSEQISIVGGWTIASNKMYANGISLTANNGRIDFENYTNPYGNINRKTAYITNNGTGSFYELYSDTLTVGGELISGDDRANPPSIDAGRTYVTFGQETTISANAYLRGNSTRIYGTGYFSGNVYLLNHATGTGTYTLFVNPQGLISRGSIPESSSIRYKNHVRELTSEDAKALYKLRPIWYKYKPEILPENDSLIDKPLPGFYAEDVAEIIPEATYKNDDGLVENWRPKEIIPYLVKTIQDQHKKIEELENKLDEILTLLKGRDI